MASIDDQHADTSRDVDVCLRQYIIVQVNVLHSHIQRFDIKARAEVKNKDVTERHALRQRRRKYFFLPESPKD